MMIQSFTFSVAILIALLIFPNHAAAQEKAAVSGRIIAQHNNEPIEAATVSFRHLNDTVPIGSVATDKEGWFRITNLPMHDSLVVSVTHLAYDLFDAVLIVKEKKFTIPAIRLLGGFKVLENVTVRSQRPSVIIRSDTIIFNASSIKTPPNSKAEALIKRIPGLTVDENGKLRFNGKLITRILVDGRPFFGEGGGVALHNIPADMIDNVQIMDAETAIEKQSNPARPSEAKAMNLKLKKGKKRFGNIGGSVGTDSRHEVAGMVSNGSEKETISVIAGVNNINKTNLLTPFPVELQSYTEGGGIISTTSAGVDYSRNYSADKRLNVNYQFNRPETKRESSTETKQVFVRDSFLITRGITNTPSRQQEHSIAMTFNTAKFNLLPTARYNMLDEEQVSVSATTNASGAVLNQLQSQRSHEMKNTDILVPWAWTILSNPRRTFRLSGDGRILMSDSKENLVTSVFESLINETTNRNRVIERQLNDKTAKLQVEYTEALTTAINMRIAADMSPRFSTTERSAWDLDTLGVKTGIDTFASNDIRLRSLNTNAQMGINYRKNKFSLESALQISQTHISQMDVLREVDFTQDALLFAPSVNLTYAAASSQLTLNATSRPELPYIDMLQPINDNSNPLLLLKGNPYLKPSNNYDIGFRYSVHKTGKVFKSRGFELKYAPRINAFVQQMEIDASGKQTVQTINADGDYSISTSVNAGNQYKTGDNTFFISLSAVALYRNQPMTLNQEFVTRKTYTIMSLVRMNYSYGAAFSSSLTYTPSINAVRLTTLNAGQQDYTLHTLNYSANAYCFKKLKLAGNLMYLYNTGIPKTSRRQTVLTSFEASLLCLKNKGEIKLSAFDPFRTFRNIYRSVEMNFIQDIQANNLQRYFMIGFVYNFSKLQQ